MYTEQMIATHPDVQGKVNRALVAAIDELYACAQSCTACADACIGEPTATTLRQCIRLNLDCADVCVATATLSSRRTGSNQEVLRKMLEACVAACRVCGAECQRHAQHHEHCRLCAESCQRCERACQQALSTM